MQDQARRSSTSARGRPDPRACGDDLKQRPHCRAGYFGGSLEQLRKRALRAGARCIRPLSMATDEAGIWQLSGATARSVDRLRDRGRLRSGGCSVQRNRSTAQVSRPEMAVRRPCRLRAAAAQPDGAVCLPGGARGYLVYATCAFERAQDEAVIERFLASPVGAAFEVIPAIPRWRRPSFVSAAAEPFTQSGPGSTCPLRQGRFCAPGRTAMEWMPFSRHAYDATLGQRMRLVSDRNGSRRSESARAVPQQDGDAVGADVRGRHIESPVAVEIGGRDRVGLLAHRERRPCRGHERRADGPGTAGESDRGDAADRRQHGRPQPRSS